MRLFLLFRPTERPPAYSRQRAAVPPWWMLVIALLALFAGAHAAEVAPVRIVSQTVGSDELLLAVAAPGQIAALSHLADDENFSAVSEEAKAYPRLPRGGDAESVLKHRPTLVLFSDYSRPELITQVRRAGVEVVIFSRYMTLEETYANLRALGRAIDPEAARRAEAAIAQTKTRVTALREKLRGVTKVRVIAPSTYGLIPGADTTFQDLCDHAGAENLGSTLGKLRGHATPPVERMLSWPVDRLVMAGSLAFDGVTVSAEEIDRAVAPLLQVSPYKFMPSVKKKQVALLKPWQMGCLSHLRVEAYEQLARQLHPEAFQP